VKVTALEGQDPATEQFVRRMPEAKLSHLPVWNAMVERTFGHKSFYLAAREGGTVQGVLPLIHVRSRLFGNRLISQAFSSYGGALTVGPDASDALYDRALELANDLQCDSMEIRNTRPVQHDLYTRTDKVAMRYPLVPDVDQLWKSFTSKSKVRNHVRKAEELGVTAVDGGIELLGDFYRVWTVRMHQLGTPCYSRNLFQGILETFPDNARIFLARVGGNTVVARFTVLFNGLAESCWAAALVEHNATRANQYLYWSVMKHYALAGAKWFDFGRSTIDSNQYRAKKQWGAQPVPLYFQYWVRPGRELSLASPDSPKYRKKVALWRRLPLWATRLLGPMISRSLP